MGGHSTASFVADNAPVARAYGPTSPVPRNFSRPAHPSCSAEASRAPPPTATRPAQLTAACRSL